MVRWMPNSGLLTCTVAPAGAWPKTLPVVTAAWTDAEPAAQQMPATATSAMVLAAERRGAPARVEEDAFMGIPALHRRGRPMSGQGFGARLMRAGQSPARRVVDRPEQTPPSAIRSMRSHPSDGNCSVSLPWPPARVGGHACDG